MPVSLSQRHQIKPSKGLCTLCGVVRTYIRLKILRPGPSENVARSLCFFVCGSVHTCMLVCETKVMCYMLCSSKTQKQLQQEERKQ